MPVKQETARDQAQDNVPGEKTPAEFTREPAEKRPGTGTRRAGEVLRWIDTEGFYDLLMEQQEQM